MVVSRVSLESLAGEAPSLAELEHLQQELYALLIRHHGPEAAASVLGRALAGGTGALQPAAAAADEEPPAEPESEAASSYDDGPAAAAAGRAALLARSTAAALERAQSDASDRSAASDASDSSNNQARWKHAVALAAAAPDPWGSRGIHKLPMEVAVRYRYTAATRQWVKDDVLVKVEPRPFAAGAMRECYAMKKLSTFSSSVYRDWRRAPNHVAKRYKKPGVERDVYFGDVVLQMDAKFLGDEYNKTKPPKKVDFMQAAVVEFRDRPGKPVMCVEHLIQGDYIKYNSNSGFVASGPLQPTSSIGSACCDAGGDSEAAMRHTPQAFSHFTFEFTHGTALCVDIQGVADLYTDPQIHTLDGVGYGDGNLALRGMALFFRSHECNILCSRLGLKPFQRCAQDVAAQGYVSSSSTKGSGTMVRAASRQVSLFAQLVAHRREEQALQPLNTLDEYLGQLQDVPLAPSADMLVHFEAARLYAETVMLPELRPDEDPDAARAGGLFHLTTAAAGGMVLAQLVLACGHLGLQPSSTQLSHLLSAVFDSGEFQRHPALSLRYCELAAQRGVRAAAAALAYAYATGEGVGAGVLRPSPSKAVAWLRVALGQAAPDGSSGPRDGALFSEAPDGLNARGAGSPGLCSAASRELRASLRSRSMRCGLPGGGGGGSFRQRVLPGGGIAAANAGDAGNGAGSPVLATGRLGSDAVAIGSMFTLADQMQTSAAATLTAVRNLFAEAAEEEAKLLPGGARASYELWADLGEQLLAGEPPGAGSDAEEEGLLASAAGGLAPDPSAAAEAFNMAAEEASSAFKGKLAQRYFQRAAEAEAIAEGDEEEEGG